MTARLSLLLRPAQLLKLPDKFRRLRLIPHQDKDGVIAGQCAHNAFPVKLLHQTADRIGHTGFALNHDHIVGVINMQQRLDEKSSKTLDVPLLLALVRLGIDITAHRRTGL